jgi:hypothetical protein
MNAFITELLSLKANEWLITTPPQLSRMDLANHWADFPGLSLLNTRAVVIWNETHDKALVTIMGTLIKRVLHFSPYVPFEIFFVPIHIWRVNVQLAWAVITRFVQRLGYGLVGGVRFFHYNVEICSGAHWVPRAVFPGIKRLEHAKIKKGWAIILSVLLITVLDGTWFLS